MVNKFHVKLLAATRLISIIAILDRNYGKTLVSERQKAMQAIFIDYYTKNDKICRIFLTILTIFYRIVVFIVGD